MAGFELPRDTHRTVIIGRTGSGKTVFAVWLLSQASIDRRPWLIVDYKGEVLFRNIDRRAIRELQPGSTVPRSPGLYITRPLPKVDDDAMENMLWRIWERGSTGLFVDEGTLLPDCAALDGIMAQGRSKRIPAIICNQRPVGISRAIFTQADYFAIFAVQNRKDQLYIEDYINLARFYEDHSLPAYHCLWHNVGRDEKLILQPVPPPHSIVGTLNERAPHRFWW